ncbi:MAG: hypothetical protein M0C28_02940 [Candidatus Moduliflexus flocculans]|nr:hypothetical protein [Candidatus Moduliflexus flocculans]
MCLLTTVSMIDSYLGKGGRPQGGQARGHRGAAHNGRLASASNRSGPVEHAPGPGA